MANELTTAPALATPDHWLFNYQQPETASLAQSDDQLRDIYEVERTARECQHGRHNRIALQFPDHMLGDAPRLAGLLQQELDRTRQETESKLERQKLWILADTSYSACCVDEIAAEHVDADVVIHYGRSCLSPTSRLPVIYVFTKQQLNLDDAIASFEAEFPGKEARVVLMADVAYHDHVPELYHRIRERGYEALLSTSIQHNPLGSIPNRAIADAEKHEVKMDGTDGMDLKDYSVFHVSSPPTALLLALSSRVASLHIFPTSDSASYYSPTRTTRALLGRRYAKLLNLTSAGVIGILVNTLSVANYLSSIDAIRRQIAAAGKKSYTVVVGKLNPAKLANFAEIEAWVVVGCWESSLVEEDASFYRPVLTPFELEVALMSDEERIWGLGWWGGIESVKAVEENPEKADRADAATGDSGVEVDEDDSEAPIFDLRTGKLVSTSRPMQRIAKMVEEEELDEADSNQVPNKDFAALTMRPKAELATVNGVFSPGAAYLRSQRTWQGLGTDFDDEQATTIEEGRGGVARGYNVGEADEKR